MVWMKGQSGNPAGKASKGTQEARAALRESILKQMPAVVKKLLAQAKAGDVAAARTLLERVLPAVKAETLPVSLPGVALATTATDQSAQIVNAIVTGQLAPDIGAELLAGISNAARIADFDKVAEEVRQLREEFKR